MLPNESRDPAYLWDMKDDCESVDMNVRFRRCENFLKYLDDQEDEELRTIVNLNNKFAWQPRFVKKMISSFESTKTSISSKGVQWGRP